MYYDPIEDDPAAQPAIRAAEQEAREELKDVESKEPKGFCYKIWRVKKRILRDKYGIQWRSPAEMNPDTIFD